MTGAVAERARSGCRRPPTTPEPEPTSTTRRRRLEHGDPVFHRGDAGPMPHAEAEARPERRPARRRAARRWRRPDPTPGNWRSRRCSRTRRRWAGSSRCARGAWSSVPPGLLRHGWKVDRGRDPAAGQADHEVPQAAAVGGRQPVIGTRSKGRGRAVEAEAIRSRAGPSGGRRQPDRRVGSLGRCSQERSHQPAKPGSACRRARACRPSPGCIDSNATSSGRHAPGPLPHQRRPGRASPGRRRVSRRNGRRGHSQVVEVDGWAYMPPGRHGDDTGSRGPAEQRHQAGRPARTARRPSSRASLRSHRGRRFAPGRSAPALSITTSSRDSVRETCSTARRTDASDAMSATTAEPILAVARRRGRRARR